MSLRCSTVNRRELLKAAATGAAVVVIGSHASTAAEPESAAPPPTSAAKDEEGFRFRRSRLSLADLLPSSLYLAAAHSTLVEAVNASY